MANSLASSSITSSSSKTLEQKSQSLYSSSSIDFNGSVNLISIKKPTKKNGIKCAFQSPLITMPKQQPPPLTATQPPTPPSKWNLLQRAASIMLEKVESAILTKETQQKLTKTVDPNVQISGNFAPVPEMPVQYNLPVTGVIPDCIKGVYLRNGANPFHKPVSGHHFFDGDGMVHAVNINGNGNNTASYACRFTETERLIQERELGRPVFPKAIGELHGHSGIARLMLFYSRCLCGLVDQSKGIGVANAGLVYFNNRLLAMSEDDLPYHVRIKPSGDLETIGRYDFNGQLKGTMIAHPKVDPDTGSLFALSYDVIHKPYLKYFNVAADGTKSDDVEIPLKEPTMMHDFAITENYVIIPDQQVVFKLQEMLKGGSPLIYDKNKKSRFGILLKNAKHAEDIVWVESRETFCFHLWNAWEEPENDEIVVIGSCMTPPDSVFNECDENLKSVLSEIRLNLKTGESRKRAIVQSEEVNLEAGMVNKNRLGRKTQFGYLAIAEPWPKVSGFAKVDLLSGDIQKYIYGDERYGGEPFFVSSSDLNSEDEQEDDGYVIAFVHDEKTGKSELQIVNAKSLKLEASIRLPSRVPYGFHGTFINSIDLESQLPF